MSMPTWAKHPIHSLKWTWGILRSVVDNYHSDMARLRESEKRHAAIVESLTKRLLEVEKMLMDSTDVSVDVCHTGPNHVIVVGRYKNQDYVRCFSINTDSMIEMIDILRSMERRGRVTIVDAPPGMSAVIKRGYGNGRGKCEVEFGAQVQHVAD